MKTIVKTTPSDHLLNANNAGWSWDDFHNNDHDGYLLIRDAALSEQRNECAYTGLWIGDDTNRTIHIDHFRKKSLYPESTFEWDNLFAAVKDPDYGADHKDSHIRGPRNHSDAQYQTFWSPLQANLENAFWYNQDGNIIPNPELSDNDKIMAENTINIFNLRANELKSKRRDLILQIRLLSQLSDDEVREAFSTSGFSFVVAFELNQRAR